MEHNKELHFDFNAPLNALDTENTTFGCRQKNPDICGANGIKGICAFCSDDSICKRPSRAWKKQYMKMVENSNEIK